MATSQLAERIALVAENSDEAFAMYLYKQDRRAFDIVKGMCDQKISLDDARMRFIAADCDIAQQLVCLGTLRHMKKVQEERAKCSG